jgi:hypothetical protein
MPKRPRVIHVTIAESEFGILIPSKSGVAWRRSDEVRTVEVEGAFIPFRAWICRKCKGRMNRLIEGIQQHDTEAVRRLERQIASDLGIQVANGTNLTERTENNQLDFLWCTVKALRDTDSWKGFEGLLGRNVAIVYPISNGWRW